MASSLCESCRARAAEFSIRRVVGESLRQEFRLCGRCAADRERVRFGEKGLLLTDLLHYATSEGPLVHDETHRTKVCPGCGMTQAEVCDSGTVGCSICYVVFVDVVDTLVADLQGSASQNKQA